MSSKIYWITKTAIFIALLVALQAVTKPMGQLVTGSAVNLVLILATILGGVSSGLTVAVISPVMALLLGIAPNQMLVPFIILGNIVFALVWAFPNLHKMQEKFAPLIVSLIVGAIVKCGVLYVSVVKIGLPFILNLPEKQALAISVQFGFIQFATALIGGIVAVSAIPSLRRICNGAEWYTV
jgi:hypothetical protein